MALPIYATRAERAFHFGYKLFCALAFIFLIAPVLVVIPLSFNAEPYFSFTQKMISLDPTGFSLRWYEMLMTAGMHAPEAPSDSSWWADVWNNATWVQAAKNSVIIGIFSTLLATVLGTIAALGLSRPEMPYRSLITAVLISPMIVPIIITATGIFFFYSTIKINAWGVPYLGIIAAHAILGIPFVIITVTATLVGFDRSLTRAAASMGASPTRAFFMVTLPLILPGIISGALFAFVTSFDEVVLVMFIAGPDEQTIPRQMWNGVRESISPAILSVATVLVISSILLLTTMELLRRRNARMTGAK